MPEVKVSDLTLSSRVSGSSGVAYGLEKVTIFFFFPVTGRQAGDDQRGGGEEAAGGREEEEEGAERGGEAG